PIAMSLMVRNTHATAHYNPVVADIYLVQRGLDGAPSHMKHLLTSMTGAALQPGEMYGWDWVQQLPGNLPGSFFIDIEVYTLSGPFTDFHSFILSRDSVFQINTREII